MNFFRNQNLPLNILTTFFVAITLINYDHFRGAVAVAYVLGMFIVWAAISAGTEKFLQQKPIDVGEYAIEVLTMTALLVALSFILQKVS